MATKAHNSDKWEQIKKSSLDPKIRERHDINLKSCKTRFKFPGLVLNAFLYHTKYLFLSKVLDVDQFEYNNT